MRRVKEKKVQPPLPSVILATVCYISVARQGMGDGTELGMKGQRPDQTSGRLD